MLQKSIINPWQQQQHASQLGHLTSLFEAKKKWLLVTQRKFLNWWTFITWKVKYSSGCLSWIFAGIWNCWWIGLGYRYLLHIRGLRNSMGTLFKLTFMLSILTCLSNASFIWNASSSTLTAHREAGTVRTMRCAYESITGMVHKSHWNCYDFEGSVLILNSRSFVGSEPRRVPTTNRWFILVVWVRLR